MKKIHKYNEWYSLDEAKLRDVITEPQINAVSNIGGDYFLDKEVPEKTLNITEGKWELSPVDKANAINTFFGTNINNIINLFVNIPQEFVDIIKESTIKTNLYKDFDIKNPSLYQIANLLDNNFRTINVNETKSDTMISRDENGVPLKDSEKKIIKVSKEPGKIVYTKNVSNINSLVDAFNTSFPEKKFDNIFSHREILNISSIVKDNKIQDFDILSEKPMYLYITGKPSDVLNMAVSRFYTSCQDLYDGSYKTQLPINIFDKNSKVAYLIFDVPYIHQENERRAPNSTDGSASSTYKPVGVELAPYIPFTRMIIRYFKEEKKGLFFDRAYPDRMKTYMNDLITKYTGMKPNPNITTLTTYSIQLPKEFNDGGFSGPYLDHGLRRKIIYGMEEKYSVSKSRPKLPLNIDENSSKILEIDFNIGDVTISENIVSSIVNYNSNNKTIPDEILNPVNLPHLKRMTFIGMEIKNLHKLPILPLEFLEIKHATIKSFGEIKNFTHLKELILADVEPKNNLATIDFSTLTSLETLYLSFSISVLDASIINSNIKKLTMSGENYSINKKIINALIKKGVDVKILGPKI